MNRHRCECSICTNRGEEIDRLQGAKRAALKIADERAKEANEMRQKLEGARKETIEECALRADNQARILDNTAERRAHIYCAEIIAKAIRTLSLTDE